MLLIGSRAIVQHFPEFRAPRDWDLIGTAEDIKRLDAILPRADQNPRTDKVHYRRGQTVVEVANASEVPYWARVMEAFANEPTIVDPDFGALHVAPAAYLLITKQCGLIYRITHWHKNLEDLYFLRDRIPSIEDRVAALLPHALADSRRMFGDGHAAVTSSPTCCHPDLPGPPEPELHAELHRAVALGARPVVEADGAWQGLPEAPGARRREAMIQLFAEEAMVVAATAYLRPSRARLSERPDELSRWALRTLITGDLPESWRYFGVNYYREIRNLMPGDWLSRLGALATQRRVPAGSCDNVGLGACQPGDTPATIEDRTALATNPTTPSPG